ncbi:hypothetical protein H0H92_013215 [Tricholoma furcatifolium]|nr:hypothetical protein H0H92_013215 [Tricholoma furcatifolium]
MLLRLPAILLAQVYLVAAWNTFVVPHTDGQDDMPGLVAAIGNYTKNSTILFQEGVQYNIWSPIKFPSLTNVEIAIEGNLSYPTDIPTIQNIVATSSYPGAWFTWDGGSNVTLRGSTDPEWGWVDGHGQAWWDTQNQVNRPHGYAFSKINGGVIRDMKIWMCVLSSDGFSSGGSNMLFENNHVENGDDCLTVGSGSINITFRNSYCANGHGLSIGSLGESGAVANVQNVLFDNVLMKNTLYGARFKSWTGGNGIAKNITWKNIALSNVRMPIYVTQNYWDQEDGPDPNTGNGAAVNNTHIQDFLFQNFVGTINDDPNYFEGSCVSDPCWYYVANATGREVVIFDLYPNTTSNIVAQDLFTVTDDLRPVAVMCNPDTVTNDVGFKCWDGNYIPDAVGLGL